MAPKTYQNHPECLMCSCDRTRQFDTMVKISPYPHLQVEPCSGKASQHKACNNSLDSRIVRGQDDTFRKQWPFSDSRNLEFLYSTKKGFSRNYGPIVNQCAWQHCMLLTKNGTSSICKCQNNAMLDCGC